MRKGLIAVGAILLMVGLASSLQAGGVINKQNLSADYIRTLNRNAATDMADAAVRLKPFPRLHLYYLLWGYLVAIASILEFIFIRGIHCSQHYMVWPVLMGLGLMISGLFI